MIGHPSASFAQGVDFSTTPIYDIATLEAVVV
jgi:hypothetical protein